MQIEVYTQTKPPLQRRPIVVSSLFLVLVGMLATQMSFSRAADPLGPTLRLSGLNCSIRPPRGFVQRTGLVGPEWRIQPFEANTVPWGHADLFVWYTRADDVPGPEHVARAILEQIRSAVTVPGQATTFIEDDTALLGTGRAHEIQDPDARMVVRVRKLPTSGYLGVSMAAETPIHYWLDTFDATCRSVKVAP